MLGIDGGQASGGTAPTHRVSLELGYFLFQYVRLVAAGFSRLSIRNHMGIRSDAVTTRDSGRSWPLSFDREARAHCIRDMTATYHPPGISEEFAGKSSHTSGPSDSSGRNTVWNFTSSVFMTVGAAGHTPDVYFVEAVAILHVPVHGAVLTVFTQEQTDYAGVKGEGPFSGVDYLH